MKRMSFMLTAQQMRDRTKTVTRRLGWKTLRPGTRLLAVERCQGIKPGQVVEVFGEIEVLDVRREPLDRVTFADCIAEGFPEMCPADFQQMFVDHMRCNYDVTVTRIEFRHVDQGGE